jgi:hypothetical protein
MTEFLNTNKKPAFGADSLDLTLLRGSDLSTWLHYSKPENIVKAVEVGGVAPPRSGLTSPISQLGTPTADISYHIKRSRTKKTKIAPELLHLWTSQTIRSPHELPEKLKIRNCNAA